MIVFICLGVAGLAMFLFASMAGGHDQGDVADDFGGHDLGHDSGPSFFSTFSLAFFLTGFGGAGTLTMASGWQLLPASTVALLGGLGLWVIAFAFMSMLHRQQADSTLISAQLLGAVGVVTVPISAETHLGKIQCGSCPEELIVRCDDKIDAGSRVVITERAGGIYLVRKWDG
ncbi:MAG TPA: NfeD family protein [Bryobacteraceae bacterium]|nr:NfeD family protein [Bryobacteraceae bacterium]